MTSIFIFYFAWLDHHRCTVAFTAQSVFVLCSFSFVTAHENHGNPKNTPQQMIQVEIYGCHLSEEGMYHQLGSSHHITFINSFERTQHAQHSIARPGKGSQQKSHRIDIGKGFGNHVLSLVIFTITEKEVTLEDPVHLAFVIICF